MAYPLKPLGEVCENLDNRRVPITKKDRIEGEIPYYGASGIVDYVDGFIFDEDLLLVSEDGANLLARTYPIAFSVTGKSWVNNHAHVLKFSESVTQKFIEYFLNSIALNDFVSGMAQPKLNQRALNSIPVPCPSTKEQKRILDILDQTFADIEQARAKTELNLKNARELFESYLQQVFSQRGEGWVEDKLLTFCEKITVGHVGSMASKYKDEGIVFLRSQNVRPFHIALDGVKYIDNNFNEQLKKSQLVSGDVAIVRTGYPGTAAVIPENLPVSNCSDLVIARTKPQLSPHFLVLFLNSSFGKELVGANLVGAAQKHFNVTAAKNVLFAAPELETQEKLVLAADQVRAELKKVENIYLEKLQALDELKKSILQKAFSGELTKDSKGVVV